MTDPPRRRLTERIPAGGTRRPEEILDGFLAWVGELGLEPYPEQEAAFLELLAGRHVVLSTPTGSGKSLVALLLHFKALCEGERSFYTAPTKALVGEKFFSLCEHFGAERVGLLTGDASINRDAPVVCCTTEVLANMALRHGEATPAPYAVLDEFHYYSDRDRGAAWEIPLLALPHTLFLLMSATLGNTASIEERLRERSGRDVVHIHSDERPVPLGFEYRETPLHETLEELVGRGEAPVYVVNFTQRECGERAQGLTSANLCTREEKRKLADAIGAFRFDSAYGRDVQRFLRHGIGVHHAGLLPKYRLLVEQLAQQGLLVVVCGTDTLGVGVNIPIRTVVFSKLCKYDGEKVARLSVREFKQIAGRAGRKGFDDRGRVVCQAPEHVIENKRLASRAAAGGKRKPAKRKAAPRGFVPWNRDAFERLVAQPPETLVSRFDVTHGMLILVLQREWVGPRGGYGELARLIELSHVGPGAKARLRRRLAALFRSLRRAGVVEVLPAAGDGPRVRVASALQQDFSLHESLSLYLVEACAALDREAPAYPLELTSLVEAILEDPAPILAEQTNRRKRELLARLKAEGVDYEDRLRRLEEVTYPKPEEEFIRASFRLFAESHPWVGEESVRPKSVAREMFEGCADFVGYAREYGVARSEGLLLRYLSQVHNTLVKTVPAAARSEGVIDVIAYLRALLQGVDTSLMDAWEGLVRPVEAEPGPTQREAPSFDLAQQPKALAARVRAELHALVRELAAGRYAEAAVCVRQDPEDAWEPERFERALAPFFAEHERLVFTPDARQAHHTRLEASGPRSWYVTQVLVDPQGENLWAVTGEVDLRRDRDPEGPLVKLIRIGT